MWSKRAVLLTLFVLVACSPEPEDFQKSVEPREEIPREIAIHSLRILPENPTSNSTLETDMVFRGGEPDHVAYQWLKNGNPIPGAIRPTLDSSWLEKGDFIAVEVRVQQAGGRGDEEVSETVIIGNSPPVVDWVAIQPAAATSSSELRAVVHGRDPDRDQVSYAYEWKVNGETLATEDGSSLESAYFRRGDQVQVAAVPFDGSIWGTKATSRPVIIQNSPPRIISEPPQRTENGMFHYPVKAEDADGDPLRYYLEGETPPGMEIDPQTGVVQWQVVIPEGEVTYKYRLVAADPQGARSVQEITLRYAP